MRLGFHYHIPALSTGKGIYTPGYQGVFLDGLARNVEQLICFLHSPGKVDVYQLDYRLRAENIRLVDIGPHLSVPQRLVSVPLLNKLIRPHINGLDCILLRGPSPLLPAVAKICYRIPKSLLIVGNQLDGVDDLPQPGWRKEVIRFFWQWNIRSQKRISGTSLTFVNSRKLLNEYNQFTQNLEEIRTTTLDEKDIFVRDDTCQGSSINLIYAGRIDRTKGLMDIARAVIELNLGGASVIFHVVGAQYEKDNILESIADLFNRQKLGNFLIYHGYKSLPDLFQLYSQSDVFVLASTHEGFPRTIWEAMVHSLPVVATDVGSIREYVGSVAKIIPPRNVSALTDGIRQVISDGKYRRNLIREGRELASQNTLQVQSRLMVDRISEWLGKTRPAVS